MFLFGKNYSLVKLSRKIIVLVLFIILPIWIGLSLRLNKHFPIKNVQVISSFEHLDSKALREMIQPYLESGFFGLQASILREQLMRLPWVRSVSIQRIWPQRIRITLVEQIAIAKWNGKSLINSYGEIFTPDKNMFPANLPQLNGSDAQAKIILQDYFHMNRILKSLHSYIVRIYIDSHYNWHLVLDNGLTMSLGREDLLKRLQLFAKVFPQIKSDANKIIESVDLRYKNGFAIKWKEIKKM